jgi:hypothetical protein
VDAAPSAPAHPAASDALQQHFLSILPRIERHARVYFRHLRCPGKKEDAVAETVAVAWKWYLRATARGKDVSQFASALAGYAVRHVRCGRKVWGKERLNDVLAPLCQQRRNLVVGKLADVRVQTGNPLHDALADNTRSHVPDQAAFRLDFPGLARLAGPAQPPPRRGDGPGAPHPRPGGQARRLPGPHLPTPARVPGRLAALLRRGRVTNEPPDCQPSLRRQSMNSSRDWLDPGGRMLDRRLDQLRSSLDRLAARLRAAVAEAVGESLGGLVGDAVLGALAHLSGHEHDPEPPRPPSRSWYEPGGWNEDDWDQSDAGLWTDDGGREEEFEPSDEPLAGPMPPQRLALTISAGLQAAAWWLRNSARRRPVLTSVLVALLVGGVAFAAPALAAALLGLAGSAGQLHRLAGWLRPRRPLRSTSALD